ncbi:MAG: phycobiliprotein lyase [Cyanobacteria bacterium P01_F01_bin.150]
MDIKGFFEQSCGKWFSQRTNQHLTYAQAEWGKSDVWIDMLTTDDPSVAQTCEKHGVDLANALFGITVKWEGFMGKDPNKLSGQTVLVPVAEESESKGKLLRHTTLPKSLLAIAQYTLDAEDVLTLTTEQDDVHVRERIWFASPNLRLRSSLLKRPNDVNTTTFYSEIRAGGVKK